VYELLLSLFDIFCFILYLNNNGLPLFSLLKAMSHNPLSEGELVSLLYAFLPLYYRIPKLEEKRCWRVFENIGKT